MSTPLANSTSVLTSVSAIMGRAVRNAAGKVLGHVHEFAVDVAEDGTQVMGIVLTARHEGKQRFRLVRVGHIEPAMAGGLVSNAEPETLKDLKPYLLLERDLLDQQIIDVDGHKVVRVNDVNLAWAAVSAHGSKLSIEEVEVGTRGAVRRLLKGLPAGVVDVISTQFKGRVIPWGCVDLIERDPARRVRLKIGQDRLAKMHPSDIAEILEELAPSERDAVFASLDEETAAEALEEIEPRLQKALIQSLDSERAADILEEMDPGAAADVLAELSEEQSDAILEEMEPEERQDVEELLEFSADSAAGRMTTAFISVPMTATAEDGIEALRAFDGDPDNITEIYLIGEAEELVGVVTLPRMLLAKRETKLSLLSEGHNKSCDIHATDDQVAALFDKYNLRSLPVLDAHKRIAGVIHAEQVIAQLLA